jgi:hypothetical protein
VTRALLLALLVAGCAPSFSPPYLTLIDQRTFNPAVAPNEADVKALPALPLAVIRFDTPDIDYGPDLARAVEAATSRKPDVEFNVVTPVGRGKAPNAQAAEDAAAIARAIAEQSVPPEKIHIGMVEDSGTPAREVRVYVR